MTSTNDQQVTGAGQSATVYELQAYRPDSATARADAEPAPAVAEEVLEGEVIMADQPGAVDAGDAPMPWRAGMVLPSVVPAWLESVEEAKTAALWAVKYAAHVAAFHTVRFPFYLLKLCGRSPRGLWRILKAVGRWTFELDAMPVRSAVIDARNAELFLKLSRDRKDTTRGRKIVTAAGLLIVLAAGFAGWVMTADDLALRYAGITAALAALGAFGGRVDKPLVSRAVTPYKAPRLTSDVVERALRSLGIGGIGQAVAKDPRAIGFPDPIARDGAGWRATVELPYGVTASEVMERREKLAAGLARPLGCVWPEGDAEVHPGRLVLWVGDQDMSKARQAAWPLRKTGATDLFKPMPLGTDQRGRWVELTLMFTSMIIGAIPRMGKTFTLRQLLLMAGLDPRAEVHAYDLKGTGDLSAIGAFAHRYRAGDEEDDLEYTMADMRALRVELRRRAKVIRELPRDMCPENKVTPELAGKRSLGLHPIVIGVDECQVWFEHPKYGDEFEEIATDLVKRGPALGIVLMLATQRPDSKAIPKGIAANASTRFCLKVMDHTANDMVLGTSKYKQGIQATTFAWTDKGTGYLIGEGADARIVRTVYIDGPVADVIAARARTARQAAGRLSGYSLGETDVDTKAPTFDLLSDILAVMPETEAKVWNCILADRLAELRPSAYGAWGAIEDTPDTPASEAKTAVVTAALKPYDVKVGQVWGTDPETRKGGNRRGVERSHILEMVTQRDESRRVG